MKRRHFLAIPALTLLAGTSTAGDAKAVEFTQEAYEQALESGKPFLLDFYAPW